MSILRRAADPTLVTLVENAASNILRSGVLLRELLAELPERSGLAEEVKSFEQEGDRITHDIIHRLNGGGRGGCAGRSTPATATRWPRRSTM